MDNEIIKSMDQHFEENDGMASHKSLSIAFGWSFEESQINLEKYIKKHPEIKPVFCVNGFQRLDNDQWNFVVRLSTSQDSVAVGELKDSRKRIYSIHKNDTTNVDALAYFDKCLDQDPVSHPLLICFPWKYNPMKTQVSGKKPHTAKPKPSPVKAQANVEPNSKISTVPLAPLVAPRKSVKRPPLKTRLQSCLKFESMKSEPEKPCDKAEEIPDPFAESDEDAYEEEAKIVQNKRRRLVFSSEDEDKEEMQDPDTSSVKKSDKSGNNMEIDSPPKRASKSSSKTSRVNHKSPQQKSFNRKSSSTRASKDLIPEDEEVIRLSPANGVKEKSASSKKSISISMKEGEQQASTVETSDGENKLIEVALAQGEKKTKSPSSTRTARKRQVTKTFVDDCGFLITEKVWEEVGEAEIKAEEGELSNPEPIAENMKTSLLVKNKENSKPKKVKQATLMSFFKK